ncbi:DegV family protein [Virgibacillus pantothenticus]|uniref:DegV domain-containing protein n=1 Tax=Virgibacillus pantothenticus TaxID=1473 RepID=A0A0L0QMG7_VIRPA|nr:DegV family protein [Virgibacillus pantothenticus]KNE19756.1 DegV domain-containing protein [Virgibacillus pantothenticus]MBU8566256.1 DegV family protein [Virgibacillus pantothenticus]MBU8600681.1 DegV family protein [Virgibacillus pantothenticus]MBU8634611.1 DegV family protein [Virgibacillus pantothenticus]MBU8640786.1 DegV family protein [Virgibacillus pantothenticus]
MKVAVMTDSTAYIPKEIRDKYDIYMVPLSVQFADASYQEEIDITTNEFYQKLTDTKELPKTSQPSIGYITSLLEGLAKEYDAVVSVHLSSGISGTYQAVVSAGEMVDGIDVYAYDSEISCMAQGFYVLEAVDMVKNGKLPDEIIQRFDEMKQTMRGYFMVDDLSNLHRGGRLNGAQAIVGSMLQVKPILHFVDKVIVPFEKIRTKKRALQRILDLLETDASEDHPLKVAFIHANNETAARDLQQRFLEKYPDADTSISYFGPVIGTHLGEGALGVTWYKK